METITTSDLSRFGYRELEMAAELIKGYGENSRLLGDGVSLTFNLNSGYVFLTDDEFTVAMMNGDKLEIFHTCFNCGNEGFAEDFRSDKESETLRCPNCNEDIA